MQFSNVIGSFVFHLLISGKIYKITCPRESRPCPGDGKALIFEFTTGKTGRQIEILCTRTLISAKGDDPKFPLAVVVAAKRCIESPRDCALDTGNYFSHLLKPFDETSDKVLRDNIRGYIAARHAVDFEPPFSVLEIVAALELEIERAVKGLKYLHQTFKVSFGWPHDQWKQLSSEFDWLNFEFNLPPTSYHEYERIAERQERQPQHAVEREQPEEWDYFICHASEDKAEVAEPLYESLSNKGAKVWFDKFSLKLGDSLRRKIDEGLLHSRFGVVVLSPDFFMKNWPQLELDGLVQRESNGVKVILPIWHKVDYEYVKEKSVLLAGRLAASTKQGIESVSQKILNDTDFSTWRS